MSGVTDSKPEAVQSHAGFSPCRRYRYTLSRTWDAASPPLVFIGLNPSTADETTDDPTIRRCIGFARRDGFGGIVMLNLFALRSTDPAALSDASDPVGPWNDDQIFAACKGRTVVAAWGVHGTLRGRDKVVRRLLAGVDLRCLGRTKEGNPRHPLYLRADAPLQAVATAGGVA